jgi:hypothetical protein
MSTKYYSGIRNKKKNAKIGEELSFASKEAYNLLRTNIRLLSPIRREASCLKSSI